MKQVCPRPDGNACHGSMSTPPIGHPVRGCEEIPTEELPGIVGWRQGARSEAVAGLPQMEGNAGDAL